MYKISLPLSLLNPGFDRHFDKYVAYCKQAGVGRIFLFCASWYAPESLKQHNIDQLNKYIPRLRSHGFEVGIWITAFGHGGTCDDFINEDTGDGLQRMVSLEGHRNLGAYCPLCSNLQTLAADWIRRLGRTDASLIMMDDDYRYAFHNGEIFCCCQLHRKLLSQELGEPFDPQRMKQALTSGGPNPWRDTWLRVQGQTLKDFAQMLRNALDTVNPGMRMSICSVLSTWDIDGVDSITLARILAGNTKPFLRLIGAPYWHALRAFQETNLATVCEYERLQQYWCKDSGIEIFCEGDSYPRPTYQVPAVYLEGFDQVMRAAGTNDGILKYMFDYTASPDYDLGYLQHHVENQPLYDVLQHVMSGNDAVGISVFEPMQTLALSHRPGDVLDNRCIPASLRFATDNSLPIRYGVSRDPVIIFGDSAELADEKHFCNGAILDITAAQILTRRGFDVGLRAVLGEFYPNAEEYLAEDELVGVVGGNWYHVQPDPAAGVDSWQSRLEDGKPAQKCPAVYTYENASGQRFVVYCFHAQESFELGHQRGLFRSWARAKQIRRLLFWLSGHTPDAICDGAPGLYTIVKKGTDSLSIALWNFGTDPILCPIVRLRESYTQLICHWGDAELNGNTVAAERLPAFSCVCFTVK